MSKIDMVEAPPLVGAFSDDIPIIFPSTFQHPDAGKHKAEPESFFKNKAVRILLDLPDGTKVPAWLDVQDFFDDPETGQRLGRGKLRSTMKGYHDGALLPFHPDEVFDTIDRLVLPAGAIGGWYGVGK